MVKYLGVFAIFVALAAGCGPAPAEQSTSNRALDAVSASCITESTGSCGAEGGASVKTLEHASCEELQARVLSECPRSPSGCRANRVKSDDCPYLYN